MHHPDPSARLSRVRMRPPSPTELQERLPTNTVGRGRGENRGVASAVGAVCCTAVCEQWSIDCGAVVRAMYPPEDTRGLYAGCMAQDAHARPPSGATLATTGAALGRALMRKRDCECNMVCSCLCCCVPSAVLEAEHSTRTLITDCSRYYCLQSFRIPYSVSSEPRHNALFIACD